MKTANKKTKAKGVKAVPEGFHTVTPFLMVSDAQALLDFIEQGLNGKTEYKLKDDDGKIVHASARIGNSPIMIGDVMGGYEPITAMLYLYVENADELYKQALTFDGTKSKREIRDEFYGDRAGCVEDPWGNTWWISTHIEDVSDEELEERKSKMMSEEHHA
ncbi:MAG TPA: VOC family protein [Chryseolinea sp.]|nr:VOC family protein [Chryseolinea sp.]